MSPVELAAARARLGGRARLVEGRAQALPFPDASFDRVTCHLALMLMDEVETAVAEARRVLRPGGRVAVVVGTGGESSAPADDAWSRLVRRLSGARFTGPRIGDPRACSEQGLRGLLGAFEDVRIELLVADLSGPEEEIWNLFLHTYTVELMSPESLVEVERSARAAWRELLRSDGTLPCVMSFWTASGRR
jgi:ubiquinone/menaquinone biosynthesis C-methylase UbiE